MFRFPVKALGTTLVLPRTRNLTVFITICLSCFVLVTVQRLFVEWKLTIERNETITRLAGGTKGEKGWSNPYEFQEIQVAPTSQITISLNMVPPTSSNVHYTGSLGDFWLDYNGPGPSDKDAVIDYVTFTVVGGIYTVTELVSPRWYVPSITCDSPTATLLEDRISVAINTLETDKSTCTFTTYHKSTISALIFQDQNDNQLRGRNEPFQTGIPVRLYDAQMNLVASQTTPNGGRVSFRSLGSGNYTLCEEIPDGFQNTQPAGNHPLLDLPCYIVELNPGRSVTAIFSNIERLTSTSSARTDSAMLIDLPILEQLAEPDNVQSDWIEVEPWDWLLWSNENLFYLPLIGK